jgi:hypothetical protein
LPHRCSVGHTSKPRSGGLHIVKGGQTHLAMTRTISKHLLE